MGLFGIYSSIADLARVIAGMGINSSGVRQIAEASGTGNDEKIARTTFVLRRITLILGVLGGIVLISVRSPISRLTFGDTAHVSEVSLLSFVVFFTIVFGSQTALIQGMQRIGDLARITMYGALLETILSIPVIYVWREKAVVPFLSTVAAIGALVSWRYARKIKVGQVHIRLAEIFAEIKPLFRLGFVIMSGGLMLAGTMYILRVLVLRHLGLEAVGLYQAAMALSSIYVGFILEAMGKDFYPRLTSIAQNDARCNELINQQVEVGLFLAAPGILATLTFAPLIIRAFYSAQFLPAFEILRWQVFGIILRVASWPMGFLLLAKGKGKLYFWSELSGNSVHVALIWAGISYFGLKGTGMAFFGSYLFYFVLMTAVSRRLTELRWSATNLRLGFMVFLTGGFIFATGYFWTDLWCTMAGSVLTIAMGLYSIRRLVDVFSPSVNAPFRSRIASVIRRA